MTFLSRKRLVAALLSGALIVPAGTAFGNDWTKPKSRLRGATIGAAAGAFLGPPGAIVGGAIGNGVQYVRQSYRHHRIYSTHGTRHHRRY